jgi:hypothetical protein
MRIDDDEFELIEYNNNHFDSNMEDIDKLISEMNITQQELRNRKHLDGTYISSPDLDDIDDVIIHIDIPNNYYANPERRIVKYSYNHVAIYLMVILKYIVTLIYSAIHFFINSKKYKKK